jgi:ABC-type multidrug transport system fused ATPase/permease subunit
LTPPPEELERPKGTILQRLRDFVSVFQYSGRAAALVWQTSHKITILIVVLSIIAGLLPAAIAYVGKWLVDGVILAAQTSSIEDKQRAVIFVGLEAGLVIMLTATTRAIEVCRSLLRALLGNKVNVMILEKALTLDLRHFEDSEFYDKMSRARRQASQRPLSLVMRNVGLVQNGISLVSYGALLLQFSSIAVIALALAALPAFIAETKFSGEAFRLFRWRTPETRHQIYLETVIAREDYVKEVKLLSLGRHLLGRYVSIFHKLFAEDRSLTLRRGVWGFVLGLLSTAAFYGAYAWIAISAVEGDITIGEMTMLVLVFKQGQSALSASLSSIRGMYEDNLYLSNLYEYLAEPVDLPLGIAASGPKPDDGIRFESVTFTYPDADEPAVEDVTFHLAPGEKLALVGENGSGKTTLIKLLTRLYEPTTGRITLDGRDLADWNLASLRQRMGVIFQDFVRYQFTVGENIGVGDVDALDDEARWRQAAELGMADGFIEQLPQGYDTQLGRWFAGGRELSLGQWQKLALSRAFMRSGADILVLDEPTASMDAEAESRIFEHFRAATNDKMAVLISHRFSTVRMADRILVLSVGRILEQGSHEQLMEARGEYHRLFTLQARGYE